MEDRPNAVYFAVGQTSLGYVGVAATSVGLLSVGFPAPTQEGALAALRARYGERLVPTQALDKLMGRLHAYGEGEEVVFDEALDLRGGSPFYRRVWEATRRIPYGQVRTYSELAATLGRPGAARAVGRALAANPWPLLVPCHRIVGRGGALVGFGGGLALKRCLLRLEGLACSDTRVLASRREALAHSMPKSRERK